MAGPTRRAPYPFKGFVNRRGALGFVHVMTIGAAGAITSQDTDSGVVAAKQGTAGLYTLTFPAAYRKICGAGIMFFGAPGANTNGFNSGWLSNNLDGGTKAGTIQLQFYSGAANAAADVANGTVISIELEVAEGV